MRKTMKVLGSTGFALAAFCLLSQADVMVLQTGLTNVFSAGATYSGVEDTTVVSVGGANSNYGGRNTGFVGADTATTFNRALISFDLTSLAGQTVVVTSAVLKIRSQTAVTAIIDVYRISAANTDWTEGEKTGALATTGESTWNKIHYNTVNWAGSAGLSTSGTDYLASPVATTTADGAWEEFVFTDVSFIADWINGTNSGLLLSSATREAAGTGKVTFFTSEYTSALTYTPILELGYTVIPEPATMGLFVFAGFGIILIRRFLR